MKLEQARRDYYRRRAKEEGFRSRAAYKLQQLNNKYYLMKRGSKVVDIGCAPGGWLQVASSLVGNVGIVVGVDQVDVKPPSKNTTIITESVLSPTIHDLVLSALKGDSADLVLADLSPKLSGIWDIDHYKQIDLCMKVVDMLPSLLRTGGNAVLKAFQGGELQFLIDRMKSSFSRVEVSKPNASRKESSEVYLVGLGFSGLVPPRPSEQFGSGQHSGEHSDSNESDW